MGATARDLRHAVRGLVRRPGFSATAALTLALAIGANTSMFSVARHLLLDPLPVAAPEELSVAYWSKPADLSLSGINTANLPNPAGGDHLRSTFPYQAYRAIQAAARARAAEVTGVTFLREVSVATDRGPPLTAGALLADGRYFGTLGVRTSHGRPLSQADDRPGAPPVAVLGHAFWRRAFGADPAAIGRTVRINGATFEIVGVTAPGYRGPSGGGYFAQSDVTVPLTAQPIVARRWTPESGSLFTADDVTWVWLMARVPRGTARSAVEQAMTTALLPFVPAGATAAPRPAAVRLMPGARGVDVASADSRRLVSILAGVAGLVLVIACVNLAGLMLARGVARQRELAVRRALGATRWQLGRQLLLESLLLALAGAAGGVALTFWSRGLLTSLLAAGLGTYGGRSVTVDVQLDSTLLAATAAVASLAALLFGSLPALRLSKVDPGVQLGHRAAGNPAPRLTLGRALIAVQIGISIPLVVGAFLFLRTIANLGSVSLGFDPRGIVVFRLDPAFAGVASGAYPGLYLDALREIEAMPGVRSATLIENALMSGLTSNNSLTLDGRRALILMNAVGPRFFETMGMRILAGRAPGVQDRPGAPHVAVVNQAAVEQVFGGALPIGRRVRVGSRDIEIIGVVNDSRYYRQRAEVAPIIFDAALQRLTGAGSHVIVKTTLTPAQLDAPLRRAVAAISPDLPVPEIWTQHALLERATARERAFTQLLAIFGGFALLLASLGVHGVTAYAVTRRTNEIGVRVALGALPVQVRWLVLRQVVVLAGAGVAIGVPVALAVGPVVRACCTAWRPTIP